MKKKIISVRKLYSKILLYLIHFFGFFVCNVLFSAFGVMRSMHIFPCDSLAFVYSLYMPTYIINMHIKQWIHLGYCLLSSPCKEMSKARAIQWLIFNLIIIYRIITKRHGSSAVDKKQSAGQIQGQLGRKNAYYMDRVPIPLVYRQQIPLSRVRGVTADSGNPGVFV